MMKMFDPGWRRRELAWLVAVALGLSACGGGGGSKPTPPPAAPAAPPSPPPPTAPQPPLDAQLSLTNADAAHAQGYTGAGVIIGVVDSGIMRSNPTVAGRVLQELIYVDPTTNNTSIDDVVGHGTWVAGIAAGQPFAKFPGGIAPGASLVSARIISDVTPKDDGSGQGNAVTAADAAFFAQTLNPALVNAGVQVMNNSWGGIYWNNADPTINQAFGQAYQPFVVQHGGLVVFAAGNESRADPSDIASLPTLAPGLGLDKGWLVAVAVDSNHPTQLASYSNACGRAMNYCLAAPGDVIVLDKGTTASTTSPTYWQVSGTSFAAPEVSGAAALVWQAYPYFSNDLVRQTLLGTARDLGAPGPDATFGYGMLDAFKAVNGPAKFDWGDVTVNFSGTSTWGNAISGAGGLIKQGPGRLNLVPGDSYTGLTQVQGGTLAVATLSSPVQIGAQGALMSSATPQNPTGFQVFNNVTNAGVLVVGQGDVHVSGNYVQQGNGRMAVSLGSQLYVNGTATLSGGDLYVYGANANYTLNSHTTVLSAYGGLTGTFSALGAAPSVALTATVNYDATSAWLNVQQVNLGQIQGLPYTVASFGAAQRTQSAFEQINSQLQGTGSGVPTGAAFVAGAASLQHAVSTEVMQKSLESLSGQLRAASAAMTFEAIDAGTRALSGRFDQLLDAPQAGSWAQNLGYHGDMSRQGYGDIGYDLGGTLVGADRRVGGSGFVGYALSQSQGLGRLAESADQGRSHALEGMLYGGMVRGAWYGMGRFGLGRYRELMRRQLLLGSEASNVESSDDGRYGVAYGESGYRLDLGGTRLTPYVNVQYAQIRRGGFVERGGYGFGLKSAAQLTARWQAGAGLRASHDWTLAGGSHLALQAHALWQRSFGLRGEVADASFSGLDQYAPVGGVGLSRYGGVLGGTLDWQITPRAGLQFGYDLYTGQRQQAQMATANFSWSF